MAFIGKNISINTGIFVPQSADPVSPAEGMLYYSNGTPRAVGLYQYVSSNWILVGSFGLGGVFTAIANYTIGNVDGTLVVQMTTGAGDKTVTLPAAAANPNRILYVKKMDSGNGACIIDGNGSETIDGALTKALVLKDDAIGIISNGISWAILSSFKNSNEVTETWTDSSANATTSVSISRSGRFIEVVGITSFTGALTGSQFEITIPASYAASSVYQAGTFRPKVGDATLNNTSQPYFAAVSLISTTTLRVFANNSGSASNITSSNPFTWASGDSITFNLKWIVASW